VSRSARTARPTAGAGIAAIAGGEGVVGERAFYPLSSERALS
jgi:hypothetical protein